MHGLLNWVAFPCNSVAVENSKMFLEESSRSRQTVSVQQLRMCHNSSTSKKKKRKKNEMVNDSSFQVSISEA